MMNRYQRKLEDARALKAQRLKAAKDVDGSARQIAGRLHLDGRNTMEGPLNLSSTAAPVEDNQAVPKNATLLRNGEQPMVAPLVLSSTAAPAGDAEAVPRNAVILRNGELPMVSPLTLSGDGLPPTRTQAVPKGALLDQKQDLQTSIATKADKDHKHTAKEVGAAPAQHDHKAADITGLKLPTGMGFALSGAERHTHKLTF